MKRSNWERRWFKLFVVSAGFFLVAVVMGVVMANSAHVAANEIVRAGYVEPASLQAAGLLGILAWLDAPVIFWSGLISLILEIAYQRRKRWVEVGKEIARDLKAGDGRGTEDGTFRV